MTDYQLPDFNVPPLSAAEPGLPALTLPDPEQPDPPRPALLEPAPTPLELPPAEQPDPPLADLLAPIFPPSLRRFPTSEHALGKVSATPAIGEAPATLAQHIAALIESSPDAQSLPSDLRYEETRTTQDRMTHRLRHLAPLLLALLSAERGLAPEQEAPDAY
uniref:Uncharacterized protein n=1 Tax=Thermogemmatispora argillosa TaxID=2045280 RepID=A0A455T726_9CHLR|nr:hypothetical protein KTA_32240 [Thermogemmatispora argillosa]